VAGYTLTIDARPVMMVEEQKEKSGYG